MGENQGKSGELGKYAGKFSELFLSYISDVQKAITDAFSEAKEHTNCSMRAFGETNRQFVNMIKKETDEKLEELKEEYKAAIKGELEAYEKKEKEQIRNIFAKVKAGFNKRLDEFESEVKDKIECVDELFQRLENLEEGVRQYEESRNSSDEKRKEYVDDKFREVEGKRQQGLTQLLGKVKQEFSTKEETDGIIAVANKKAGELVGQYNKLVAIIDAISSRVERVESMEETVVKAAKDAVHEAVTKVKLGPGQIAELKMQASELAGELVDIYVREELPKKIREMSGEIIPTVGARPKKRQSKKKDDGEDFATSLGKAMEP